MISKQRRILGGDDEGDCPSLSLGWDRLDLHTAGPQTAGPRMAPRRRVPTEPRPDLHTTGLSRAFTRPDTQMTGPRWAFICMAGPGRSLYSEPRLGPQTAVPVRVSYSGPSVDELSRTFIRWAPPEPLTRVQLGSLAERAPLGGVNFTPPGYLPNQAS